MLEQEAADDERHDREPPVHEEGERRADRGDRRGVGFERPLDVPLGIEFVEAAVDCGNPSGRDPLDVANSLLTNSEIDRRRGVLGHACRRGRDHERSSCRLCKAPTLSLAFGAKLVPRDLPDGPTVTPATIVAESSGACGVIWQRTARDGRVAS
jgi:hypothetical protein